MSLVTKEEAAAAEKDISHFSSSLRVTAGLLPSGVCSRAGCSSVSSAEQGEVDTLQEMGRILGIMCIADQHGGEQAVIDALRGKDSVGGNVLFGTLLVSSSSLSPYPGPLCGVRGWGGWAFGEEGETIPEMSCYSRRRVCFVWFKR